MPLKIATNTLSSAVALMVVILSLLYSNTLNARSTAWFEHDHGSVRLIAARSTVGDDDTINLGLQFRMNSGWKIYWRSPGAAGFPPELDLAGSLNIAGYNMAWPVPERFSVLNMETLGYKKEVVFPITATLFEPGKLAYIHMRVRFLTCNDICIPHTTILKLTLPVGFAQNTPETAIIALWRHKLPKNETDGPLSIRNAEVEGNDRDPVLLVEIVGDSPLNAPDLFVEGPPGYVFDKPVVEFSQGGRNALMRLNIRKPPSNIRPIAGASLTFTAVDGERAIEKRVTLNPANKGYGRAGVVSAQFYQFIVIVGLAIIGGFILNFMPCVLPVLSLKLLSIVLHGQQDPRHIRMGFVATAAGIIFCFILLGTIAISLKSFGIAAGWGIQFQQPVFLVFMIAMIALFIANIWGLFEIRVPTAITGLAIPSNPSGGMGGHFLTGVFATLLATPCTSPFLGTAVGFAFTQGPLEIYCVFLALGFGLALPWITVAVFPTSIGWLPKPGHWMLTFKRVLAVSLIGTGVWLFYILWAQIGVGATVMVALLTGAIVFSLGHYRFLSERARFATWILIVGLTAISMAFAGSMTKVDSSTVSVGENGVWRAFSPQKLEDLVSKGNMVFVDVTAEWCLTCQVNKTLVLKRGKVARIIAQGKLVALRADWTRPDKSILDYLKSFQRSGIPFNVVYGPGAPDGIILPEILTERIVLTAIEKAKG